MTGGRPGPPGGTRSSGTATTTVLLRHGQTALSAGRRFAGRTDAPLSDVGREQAARAAASLAGRGGISAVVCSPLDRTRRTADAVAEATGAVLAVDEDLAEADFGAWEGMTYAEVTARWPEEMAAWSASSDVAPPGGESLSAVMARALLALDRIVAGYPAATVVVVSHVTPIKSVVCRALLAPVAAMFRMRLDVASLTEVDWFGDGSALLLALNDTAHLRDIGQPVARAGRPAHGAAAADVATGR